MAQFYPRFSHRSCGQLQKVIGVGLGRVDVPGEETAADFDDPPVGVKVNQVYREQHEEHVDAVAAGPFKIEQHGLALAKPPSEHEATEPLEKGLGLPYLSGHCLPSVLVDQRRLFLQETTSNMF